MPTARIVSPTPDALLEATARLQDGGLVAFATETVYGLGANALDAEAVAGIFAAKGRPSTNPVIVHVPDANAARALVSEWTPIAQKLADAFWPGPLTLVLPKADTVPDIVTAGGATVGLRVPAHPVALALLRAASVPVAAPSANRSEEVSPTTAQHVADSLGAFVDDLLILDGGPCSVGLESTVLDVTGDVPHILRPGMVTAQMLREVVGEVLEGNTGDSQKIALSPGQMPRHYAPRKPLLLVPAAAMMDVLQEGDALLVYRTLWQEDENGPFPIQPAPGSLRATRPEFFETLKNFGVAPTPVDYARNLYSKLRNWDAAPSIRRIVVVEPPHTPEWAAVHDRLRRAATPKENTNK